MFFSQTNIAGEHFRREPLPLAELGASPVGSESNLIRSENAQIPLSERSLLNAIERHGNA